MPANSININLLGSEAFDRSVPGRFMTWITTWGRYIMVTTELVVLVAFFSRFSLDRHLTDLKEEISQKQVLLEANQQLEANIRETQERLKDTQVLISQQSSVPAAMTTLHTLMPQGIYLTSLTIDKNKITAKVIALTVRTFTQFFTNLQATKKLTNVELGQMEKKALTGITFTLTANIPNNVKP